MSRGASQDRKDVEETLRADARQMLFSSPVVDELVASATPAELRTVGGLPEKQMETRAGNQLARRVRRAKLPAVKSMDGYGFSQVGFPEGYGVDDLRSPGFVDACQDFAFRGKTGRGKARLAVAAGIAAADAGKTVRFHAVAQLVMHLAEVREKGELRRELEDMLATDPLILDEPGYVPLDIEGASPPYQVMPAPEGKQSMLVATDIGFSKWGTVFGDDKMASAVVGRLVYTGRLVEFNGPSYRMENASMLGKGKNRAQGR